MPPPASTAFARWTNISSEPRIGAVRTWAALACLAVPCVILALHAALLPQGRWYDEYFTFGAYRLYGWPGFIHRLASWSPRPVSEALIWGYWRAVHATGRPLVAPALLVAWGLAAQLLALAAKPWRRPGRGARLALVLALPAAALLSGPVEELYYWPFGALAYLPALGAAGFVTIQLAGPGLRHDRDRLAVAAALTLGAGSVEFGMFAALLAGPLLLVAEWAQTPAWRRLPALAALAPAAAAAAVLVWLVHGRLTDTVEISQAGLAHHPLGAIAHAVPWLLREIAAPDPGAISAPGVVSALATKILVMAGAWAALGRAWPERPPVLPVLALLAALAGAAFMSIAAAYYQFGAPCCERHASYRQALFLLMLVAAASLLPRWQSGTRWPVAPALLALALLPPLPARLLALRAEFGLAPARAAARTITFTTGWAPGPAPLRYVIPPPGPLLRNSYILPGSYALKDDPPWYIQGPMQFFGKDHMDAVKTP